MTGTRTGMTEHQHDWIRQELCHYDEFHHGACVGSDETAHHAAIDNGITGERLVVHPPVNTKYRMAYDHRALWLPAKNYHPRNIDIVDATAILLATPDGPERPNSGTWYTVRYAMNVGKPITICYPDGRLEHR